MSQKDEEMDSDEYVFPSIFRKYDELIVFRSNKGCHYSSVPIVYVSPFIVLIPLSTR